MAIERFFYCPRTLAKLQSWPLRKHLEGFCDYLLAQDFSPGVIRRHLGNVSHLNKHLGQTRTQPQAHITAVNIENFFKAYSSQCRYRGDLEKHLKSVNHSINRFIDYLNTQKCYDPLVSSSWYTPILADYLCWMRNDQLAAKGTLDVRRHYLIKFLEWLGPPASAEALIDLTGEQVEEYLITFAKKEGKAARRSMQALIDAVEVNSRTGIRDLALLLLLYNTGARVSEIVTLEMEDLRFHTTSQITLRGKGHKTRTCPLCTRNSGCS